MLGDFNKATCLPCYSQTVLLLMVFCSDDRQKEMEEQGESSMSVHTQKDAEKAAATSR